MKELQCIWPAQAQLGEGVMWHPLEQAVYWLDIIGSNLHRYKVNDAGNEQRNTWHYPGSISAIAMETDGKLIATFSDGIYRLDLKYHTKKLLQAVESEIANNRFNDGAGDMQGNFWFGSMDNTQLTNSGRFYCMSNQGNLSSIDEIKPVCITNGPAFSGDGKWGYFTDTLGKKIYRASFKPSGIKTIELHINLDNYDSFPDGMTVDNEGYLWICHFAGARISRFTPSGQLDKVIPLPVPNITKCAFGGPKLNTLYITTATEGMSEQGLKDFPLAGGLFAIELDHQGFITPGVAAFTQ